MESSRIFVKNLPPTISEADFRKHFSAQGREVTDVKLIPNRRIGFVGYKSHDDAAKAVKYFNKSFIRMSRIAVDLAKPIADSTPRFAAKDGPRHGVSKTPDPKPNARKVDPVEEENTKKRKRKTLDEADPKLQEYLEVMGHPTKKSRDEEALNGGLESALTSAVAPAVLEAGESDDEYEDIPARRQNGPAQGSSAPIGVTPAPVADGGTPATPLPDEPARGVPQVSADATDEDWLRSRTSRLLDLVDPDDPGFAAHPSRSAPAAAPASAPQEPPPDPAAADVGKQSEAQGDQDEAAEDSTKLVEKTCRLFLRNLSYTVTEDDIREYFGKFGSLEEVNLPLDSEGKSKGFAMVQYEEPSAAVAAFQTDGSIFQGRILHILPAAAKRENKLDEFAISKLPLKKQQLLRKKAEAASSTFNWNSLFMSQDAVNTAVAERLGVSKHELLDPTDASAAVKQAIAETTVIQEAKAYFAGHGVNIEAFKSQQRGDTSILVKNIRNASIEELRALFEEHGSVLRVLMPPSGTIAIVQFSQPAACRAAFAKKAYSRFKDSVLFLEKGPKGLFVENAAAPDDRPAGVQKPSVADLLERDDDAEEQLETASLFVRNLNFSTTTEGLTNAFKPLDGFVSAKVKTKADPKRPGQVLSMGFGFCAFRTKEQAQAALKVMDGYVLDGYKLIVKASHRGHDAAEERRREDLAKKAAAQRTKIVIKNLPFEASKKDVRALFNTYGKLVALRLPKKFNQTSRGFAFAEFATAKEALNAITALKDTHLLGRRLVLDFAEADEVDPEEQIKAMEKKIRGQVNKVTLQQLTGEGRRKMAAGPTNPVWHRPGSMELPVRLRVLPPHYYSPSPDHTVFEGRRGVLSSRQALQESTGNIQHPQPHHMAWFAQQLEALSSIPPSLSPLPSLPSLAPSTLAPPVLRTQSLGPENGDAPTYARPQQQRHDLDHLHVHLHGRRRLQQETNPLMPLLTQAFQNYRKKQADKADQKWPDALEGPFLDALLLIPQMRRKKYTMKQTQYGRNMLIGEYLWIAYCQSLPPGVEPDPQMMRERKKVSSHIQVLKNFFSNHRCFHFFFGQRQEDKERDNIETLSLKNNSVLIALSEGRLPDERPNYEYFAQILSLNEQVQFRPRRCWIFVSHEHVVIGEDGTGHLPATGGKLGQSEYPHIPRNLERDTWAKEEQQFFKGALLHEFTKELHQVESSSVRELSKKWESAFPDLHQRLNLITSTTTDARCDILHMHATLELKEKSRFPSGSNLSSWVEISVEQPRLLNHQWKVETRLVRPSELGYSHGESDPAPEVIYESPKREFTIPYQHRPDCDGPRNDGRAPCDCLTQRCRRDSVTVPFPVPFPADVWAQTLTSCAEYPAHPFSGSKRHDRDQGAATRPGDDRDGPRSRRRSKLPTQMDLVPKIAMMQEIFSCPPPSSTREEGGDSGSQGWTRRAVILWTFETIHSVDKGKLVTAQGGRTNWRFLTILDPASDYHQRHAIASHSLACASPRPRHLSASMSENFSSAWDSPGGLGSLSGSGAHAAYSAHFMPQTIASHSTATQAAYGLLDSFSSHSGLATPPPTASLASSFAQAFDASSAGSNVLPTGIDATVTDPFLSHVGTTHGYSGSSGAHPHRGFLSWAPGGQQYHHDQHHQMHHRQQQPWESTTGAANNIDEHDSWTTMTTTSPNISGGEATTTNTNNNNSTLTTTITRADDIHGHHHDNNPHGDHHHHTSSGGSTTQEASQEDWEHIHHINLHPSSAASSHNSSHENNNHLSQDWEVIVHPLLKTETETADDDDDCYRPSSVSASSAHPLSPPSAGGKSAEASAPAEEDYSQLLMMRGLKRARSDEDGLGDDEDGGEGYRRLRSRTSMS
ncbi:hypothetical protein C8A03DRAFT_43929 [Achaetomium macrosporum]|uniref:Multiple RNA-binding domain-containing protein 1 n=1 Tax=Achaetomium macrosporum TaxID=79813 RepID=A0AAN7CAQ8_9PEZI|nr:hypothetical protein C8A03DRAFT_43929 [Achaetomium macrosporum]